MADCLMVSLKDMPQRIAASAPVAEVAPWPDSGTFKTEMSNSQPASMKMPYTTATTASSSAAYLKYETKEDSGLVSMSLSSAEGAPHPSKLSRTKSLLRVNL